MSLRALAPVALLALLAGCVDNGSSLSWGPVCSLPDPDSDCAFSGECEAQYLGEYFLDVSQSERMWLFVELRNQLPNNEDLSSGRQNNNNATVDDYVVDYDSAIPLPSITYPIGEKVESESVRVFSVFPIADAAAATLALAVPASTPAAPQYVWVNAKVKARGTLDNGMTFETAAKEIPIRVCNGCIAPCTQPTVPVGSVPVAVCPPEQGNFSPLGQVPLSYSCYDPAAP